MRASRLLFAVLAALMLLGACRTLQNALLFQPRPLAGPVPSPPAGWRVEALAIERPDGATLRGWRVSPPSASPRAVLYFGGNAEEVSWLVASADRFGGRAVVLANYRGFGGSDGKPSEEALAGDAIAWHDRVARDAGGAPVAVAAMGRSLGTGVAIRLAAERAVDRVVLVSPYDSIAAVAAHHFPAALVRAVVVDRYDAAALAPRLAMPMLAVVAPRDEVIPVERSRALVDAWGGPKRVVEIARAGHNDLQADPAYWREIGAFLAARP
jgi:pimeloyl-ACP methyl ester carboxylesterase